MKAIRFFLFPLLFCGCSKYYIAATTIPAEQYDDSRATVSVGTLPKGSAVLVKKPARFGMVKVRYHTEVFWHWVALEKLAVVPDVKANAYSYSYVSIETRLASPTATSTGYSSTILEGSRGGKYYINKNGKKTYVPRSTKAGSSKSVGGKGSRGSKP